MSLQDTGPSPDTPGYDGNVVKFLRRRSCELMWVSAVARFATDRERAVVKLRHCDPTQSSERQVLANWLDHGTASAVSLAMSNYVETWKCIAVAMGRSERWCRYMGSGGPDPLPVFKVGGIVRLSRDDLDAWLLRQRAHSLAQAPPRELVASSTLCPIT